MVYPDSMIEFEGHEGVITRYDSSIEAFKVNFTSPKEDFWYYPAEILMTQLEGDLLGYVINDTKYGKIIADLAGMSESVLMTYNKHNCHFSVDTQIYNTVLKYDLLDVCTPVYKKDIKLPEINGHAGEDKGDYIQYGCAKLLKSWFERSENRQIFSLELNIGTRISPKEMSAIRIYLESKK